MPTRVTWLLGVAPAVLGTAAQGAPSADVAFESWETLERMSAVVLPSSESGAAPDADIVEVSSRRPLPLDEAPAIVSVFSAAQLKQLGLATLADVLEYTVGTLLIRLPNAEFAPVVRGLATENGVAVLIDGMPILDTVTGRFAHYTLPLLGFKRVEILRGPGSALYGGNAQAAVINLVSRTPEEVGTEAAFWGGAPQALRGHAAGGLRLGPAGRLSLDATVERDQGESASIRSDGTTVRGDLAHAGHPNQSLVDPLNPSFVGARAEPRTSALGLLRWSGPAGLRLASTLAYRDVSPLVAPGVGGGRTASSVVEADSFRRSDLLLASEARWSINAARWAQLYLSFRHVLNRRTQQGALTGPLFLTKDRDSLDGPDEWPEGVQESLHYEDQTFGGEVQANLELPLRNRALVGASVLSSSVSNLEYRANIRGLEGGGTQTGYAPAGDGRNPTDLAGRQFILPGAGRRVISGFFQDVFSATPWLDVIAALRFDHIADSGIISEQQLAADRKCEVLDPFTGMPTCTPKGYAALEGFSYSQLSPRAGVVAKPLENLSLKVLYGQSFTPPSLEGLTNQTTSEQRNENPYGNPFLNPVLGQTLEAAVSVRLGKALRGRVGGFRIWTSDELVFDPRLESFVNNASRQITGVEVEVSGQTPRLFGRALQLGYRGGGAWQSTEATSGSEALTGVGADIYPRLSGNLWLMADLYEKASLNLGVRAVSSSLREARDGRPAIGGRALVDVVGRVPNFPVSGFELGVVARNILDKRYADPLPQFLQLAEDYPRGERTILGYVEYRQ